MTKKNKYKNRRKHSIEPTLHIPEFVYKDRLSANSNSQNITDLFANPKAKFVFPVFVTLGLATYSLLGTHENYDVSNLSAHLVSRVFAAPRKVEIKVDIPASPDNALLNRIPKVEKREVAQVPVEPLRENTQPSSSSDSSSSGLRTHVVQSGETLTRIANRYHVDLRELATLNGIEDINKIYVGQMLQIPERHQPYIIPITDEELDLLQRLVEAEAGAEPYLGKVAVAAVVINRVLSPDFPNTVRDVIYQPNQFQPVKNGKINQVKPSEETISAVFAALKGVDPLRGSLYFYNPIISDPEWAKWHTTRQPTGVIGQHHFSR